MVVTVRYELSPVAGQFQRRSLCRTLAICISDGVGRGQEAIGYDLFAGCGEVRNESAGEWIGGENRDYLAAGGGGGQGHVVRCNVVGVCRVEKVEVINRARWNRHCRRRVHRIAKIDDRIGRVVEYPRRSGCAGGSCTSRRPCNSRVSDSALRTGRTLRSIATGITCGAGSACRSRSSNRAKCSVYSGRSLNARRSRWTLCSGSALSSGWSRRSRGAGNTGRSARTSRSLRPCASRGSRRPGISDSTGSASQGQRDRFRASRCAR